MKFISSALAILGSAALVSAESLCDKYTTAVLTNNTAANQLTLLTVLVNTVVIGNYSAAGKSGYYVPGILAAGDYQGTPVSLVSYFDGSMNSTNVGVPGAYHVAGNNSQPGQVNFLDGGGPTPLLNSMPANNVSSHQYGLMTHLYEYFGVLLNCSLQSTVNPSPSTPSNSSYPYGDVSANGGFNSYQGDPSMYDVHRYMNLSAAQVGYFIQQVALAAASLGVSTTDIVTVGDALATTFTELCSPGVQVIPNVPATYQLDSLCVNSTCSKSSNPSCSAYPDSTRVQALFSAATNTANDTSQTNPTQSLNVSYIASLLNAQAAAAQTPTATPAPVSAASSTSAVVAIAATVATAFALTL